MWHRGQTAWRLVLDLGGLQLTGGGSEAEMAVMEDKEAIGEAEDITMTETANMTATETEIGTETEMGARATND